MIRITRPRRARRPGMIAMIDVVFLLIVFFMVAARLDARASLPLAVGGGGSGTWDGPPRLVDLGPQGAVSLNGVSVAPDTLVERLRGLMPGPDAPVIVSLGDGVTLADLAPPLAMLQAAGLTRLILMAAP